MLIGREPAPDCLRVRIKLGHLRGDMAGVSLRPVCRAVCPGAGAIDMTGHTRQPGPRGAHFSAGTGHTDSAPETILPPASTDRNAGNPFGRWNKTCPPVGGKAASANGWPGKNGPRGWASRSGPLGDGGAIVGPTEGTARRQRVTFKNTLTPGPIRECQCHTRQSIAKKVFAAVHLQPGLERCQSVGQVQERGGMRLLTGGGDEPVRPQGEDADTPEEREDLPGNELGLTQALAPLS